MDRYGLVVGGGTEGLVESDAANRIRADLGPPDRVVAVSTYRRNSPEDG